MSDVYEYRCPQCGTNYASNAPQCPFCGVSNTPLTRQAQIEQLLHSQPGHVPAPQQAVPIQPVTPAQRVQPLYAAPYPPAQPPMTDSAFPPASSPSPAFASPAPVVESIGTGAPPVHVRVAQRLRGVKRRNWLILGVAVLFLILVLVLLISLTRGLLLGYHASPERVFNGLQKAIDNQDADLYRSLFLTKDSQNAYVVVPSNLPSEETRFELVDVIMGNHGKYAIAMVKYDQDETQGPYTISIPLVKVDGKWYVGSNM